MRTEERMCFCTECRKITNYYFKKEKIHEVIRDHDYEFIITDAVCSECGSKVTPHGLIDLNNEEIDLQYRAAEHIITVREIENLMKIYNIGKAPLSLALGFGEITITRYLDGQVPSKEYSDILYRALSSPDFMREKLEENKEKIAPAAYHKAMFAIDRLNDLFRVSEKLLNVLFYIFKEANEITPLALEKLLYYIQGISLAVYSSPVFSEDCEAWVHGPVYRPVYNLFRDFKYNPIEDSRFSILSAKENLLSDEELHLIDLVISTFGMYSAKTLEQITHQETPWLSARAGYADLESCTELITKESMKNYFSLINETYPLSTKEGISSYIQAMLEKESSAYKS